MISDRYPRVIHFELSQSPPDVWVRQLAVWWRRRCQKRTHRRVTKKRFYRNYPDIWLPGLPGWWTRGESLLNFAKHTRKLKMLALQNSSVTVPKPFTGWFCHCVRFPSLSFSQTTKRRTCIRLFIVLVDPRGIALEFCKACAKT